MSYFSGKPSDSRCSLLRLVFSFALPLLLLVVFFGKQFLNFNDNGLSNGFSHPLTGWDHLLTMLAVGVWAAQLRGRAIWMLPLAFVSVMSLGGLAGATGLKIPNVDGIILLSCAVFSILITRKVRFSSKINILIVAFFAFFHGFAHGQEISTSASLVTYTLGFMLATLLLHGAGILVAKLVVLAVSCLLTIIFSSSAFAKTAEFVVDINDNHPIINQFQDTVTPPGFDWLTLQQQSYKAGCIGLKGNQVTTTDFARQDAGGDRLLFGICKLAMQTSDMTNRQTISHKGNNNSSGDYGVVSFNHHLLQTRDIPANQLFYPSFSSDCSNLDFKNYFPKINHTPGRHFLSNGVGLTSPPVLFSFFVVLRQFQNSSFSYIEAFSLQPSIANLHTGNSVPHSLGLSNFNDLSLATSITVQQFVPGLRDADDFNAFAPLFNYFNPRNSFATGHINTLHRLSLIPEIPLFAGIVSADHNFFLSKHNSNQLDRLIKIIT